MYNKSTSLEPQSFMHLQLNNIGLSYLSFKCCILSFVQKGTFMINFLSITVKEYLSQDPCLRRSELTSAAKLPKPLQTSTAIPAYKVKYLNIDLWSTKSAMWYTDFALYLGKTIKIVFYCDIKLKTTNQTRHY